MALENPNIVCEQARKRMDKNELSDCVISYIFSLLDTKDMAKTMVLSKRWQYEWLHREDMVFNFDMHDMFDHDKITSYDSFMDMVQKFTKIVGQCIKNYQGPNIRLIRVCFSFGDQPSYFIDRLISDGALKGVERIELLLYQGKMTTHYVPSIDGYELSKYDSLKYLHLQQCNLVLPMDFSGIKNLQTLVLEQITLKQNVLHGLFSKCIHLVKVTLLECYFTHDINIISTKLCHLVIVDFRKPFRKCPFKITVDAVNLLSFEYNCPARLYSIKAPKLLKFFWGAIHDQLQSMRPDIFSQFKYRNLPSPFHVIASLNQLENLVLSTSDPRVGILSRNLCPFQNVRQLEISFYGKHPRDMGYFQIRDMYGEYPSHMGYLKILDIVMASPNLQKLVLTISLKIERKKEGKRKHTIFFHNHLKYVELRCCFGDEDAIELARHFLKNVNSLEQITFSPCDRLSTGAEQRSDSFDCPDCLRHDLVLEKLQDEVSEKCQLVIF